jgi:hypothetical protein
MKKHLLIMMLLALFAPWAANAQETLTVYNGTNENNYVPFYGLYADDGVKCEFVIPADQLEDMTNGTISSMKFYLKSVGSNTITPSFTVFVKEVDFTTFTAFTGTTGATTVFNGAITFTKNTTEVEVDFPFSSGYSYEGGNLLIGIYQDAALGSGNYSQTTWYGVNQSGSNTAWSGSGSGSGRQFLPKTTFTYEPAQPSGDVCEKPATCEASDVTSTSAILTWSGGSGTYNVEVKGGDWADWTEILHETNLTTTTLTLQPTTSYQARVQSVCDGSTPTSGWKTSASFTTPCGAYSIPYTYGFEDAAPFACWTVISGNITRISGTPNTGSYRLDFRGTTSNMIALPQFNEATNNLRVEFWTRPESTGGNSGKFAIGYMTDITDASTFVAVETYNSTEMTTSYVKKTVDFANAPVGANLAMRQFDCSTNYYWYVDDVTVKEIPSCLAPTALDADASTDAAELSWTANSNETAWTLYWKKTTDENYTEVANATNPYTLNGLTAATNYQYYVVANCSADEASEPSEVFTFATECEVTAALGYTENFDSYTAGDNVLPTCWNYINTTTYSSYAVYPRVYANGSYSTYAHTAPNCLYFYSYYSSWSDYDPQPQYAILPEMDNLDGKQITLYAKGYSSSSTLKVGRMTDPKDASTFSLIQELTLTTSYQEFEVELTGTGNYIALMIDAATSSRNTNGVYVDDIVVENVPTCKKPSALMLETPSSRTAHTATLKWTNGAEGQTAWQIAYSTEANFDPNTVEPVDVTTNPATIEGLAQSTTYYAYVRANCGDDDFSAWCNNKVTFSTLAGNVTPTGLAVDAASITSESATVNWTGVATNDYHQSYDVYYSRLSTLPDPLENDSLITGITATNYTFNHLDAEKTYYVWVRDNCGNDGLSAWSSRASFTTASSCQTPDGLDADDVTNNSASITWNTYGLSEFNLRYGTDGENWTVKSNVNTPDELTGLTGNTTYQVQVQAACNPEAWSSVYSFTTACDAITTFPWGEDFESYPATTSTYNNSNHDNDLVDNCWVNEHISGDGTRLFQVSSYSSTTGNTTKKLVLPDQSDGTMTKLCLPAMTLPNANYQFVIDVYRSNNYSDKTGEGIRVFVSTDGEINGASELAFIPRYFEVESGIIPAELTGNQWYTYELPIGISGTCYIILRGENQYGTSTYMDNFAVEEIPSCARPSDLMLSTPSSKTAHTATLSWTNGAEGQEVWQIAYSTTASFDPTTVTPVDVTENPGTISGLDANTTYYAYVRANCGNNEYSPWSRKSCTFKTTIGNAVPTGLAVDNASITSKTATVNWTGVATNDYHVDYELYYSTLSTMPEELEADSLFTQITEISYQFTDLESEKTYYVWVRDNCGTDGYSNWSTRATFTTPSACETPDGLAASNVTTTSATFTWNVYGLDEFNLRYGTDGENWTVKSNVNTPYELTELTAATTYQVQVQATCNTEEWSTAFSFTTALCNAEDQCQITLELTDAWGDGWNGNYLQVVDVETNIILGEFTNENLNGTTGSGTNETNPPFTLNVCDGRAINFVYVLGSGNTYPAENSFVIYNNWGQVICQHVKDNNGPTPGVVGTYTVNCTEATFTKTIEGHEGGSGKWYLIASPIATATNPETVENMIAEQAEDYDLYKYNEASNMWCNYKPAEGNLDPGFNLVSGEGYLYANRSDVELIFVGSVVSGSEFEVRLNRTDSAANAGWNLVGNPFSVTAYIDRPFYTTNNDGSELIDEPISRGIEPMEGVFVEADEDGDVLTFTTTAPSKNGKGLVLNLSQGHGVIDRAVVRFDQGRDLHKFQLFESSTKLFIERDGEEYAIVNAEAQGEMPVSFKAEKSGGYTLSFNTEDVAFGYLHLIDNMTGDDVDLLVTPSYSFEARNDDYASRFKLVFATGNNSEESFAFIGNGQIILQGVDATTTVQVIDALGRILVSDKGVNAVPTDNMTPGVYVLRLVNGDNTRTQKIVIK